MTREPYPSSSWCAMSCPPRTARSRRRTDLAVGHVRVRWRATNRVVRTVNVLAHVLVSIRLDQTSRPSSTAPRPLPTRLRSEQSSHHALRAPHPKGLRLMRPPGLQLSASSDLTATVVGRGGPGGDGATAGTWPIGLTANDMRRSSMMSLVSASLGTAPSWQATLVSAACRPPDFHVVLLHHEQRPMFLAQADDP